MASESSRFESSATPMCRGRWR